MVNCLPLKFDMQSDEFRAICKEYGETNVENALIFIAEQRDQRGHERAAERSEADARP